MIQIDDDNLVFSFPEVHPGAKLRVRFLRTLRIPDDGRNYPLPPGLGEFPLRHVDDFKAKVPEAWRRHGGVMLPMYQSEAMWISFDSDHVVGHDAEYPFAVKVAAGKIDAVSGEAWREGLRRRPQNYVVAPEQPWLDGFCVEKGVIRQFVAMPLGAGYTAEEQITGRAEVGGIQIAVHPMRREVFLERFPARKEREPHLGDCLCCCLSEAREEKDGMGLAPGGRMRQEIYEDPFLPGDWETETRSRCFVHIANSMVWRQVTGAPPPTVPLTAAEYTECGLPWFEYYAEAARPLDGSPGLARLKSVAEAAREKGQERVALPENESAEPKKVVEIAGVSAGAKKTVREGTF